MFIKIYYDAFQIMAILIIGFVKDAKEHVDVQGFNVYHKNRLIKVGSHSLIHISNRQKIVGL